MTSNRPYFEIANPEIPEILRGLPQDLDVLDVGCGSGVHGAELKQILNHRVVGVDLSEASILKAKTRLAEDSASWIAMLMRVTSLTGLYIIMSAARNEKSSPTCIRWAWISEAA